MQAAPDVSRDFHRPGQALRSVKHLPIKLSHYSSPITRVTQGYNIVKAPAWMCRGKEGIEYREKQVLNYLAVRGMPTPYAQPVYPGKNALTYNVGPWPLAKWKTTA
jgi:hypothetical protein